MTIPGIDLGSIDLSNLMTYLYVIIGIALLAGIFGGYMKGLKKTIYTTAIYIGVYVAAWVALPMVVDIVYELNIGDMVKPYVAQYFNMELFGQPITSIKNLVMVALGSFVPGAEVIFTPGSEALAFIEGAAIMVVRIVVFFVLLFVGGIVINLLGRILWTFLFKKVVGDTKYKDKDKTKKTNRFRLLGAAVGAVKGLFEALIIIVPIGGLMSIMTTLDSDTLRTLLGENPAQQTSMSEQEPDSVAGIDAEAIVTFIEEYKTSILAQIVSQIKVGSEQKQIDYYIIDELGKIETQGNRKIYLREEIVVVLEVISEFPGVFTGEPIDPFGLEAEQINRVIEKLKQSRLIPELIIIGVDYALTLEEVSVVIEEYEIDITLLEEIDWYQEFHNILDIGGNVLKIGNPQEVDFLNIDANIITGITTSIAASQIINIALPIAVNYALNLPEVQEMLGEIEYDFSEIVWGDEIIAIGNIYISITELELDIENDLGIGLLDRLSDEVFFEGVLDVIGAISTSNLITQLAPALADAAYNSFAPEDFQGVLSFRNLQPEDWKDEFRRLLNIVVAITELGLLSGEEIDPMTLDMDAVRSIIENLFDLVVIRGNEGVLVTKLINMIPPIVDGFEPNLDASLNWKEQALQFVNILEAFQTIGSEIFQEGFDFTSLLSAENADALANILIQLNHSLILREIIPALINSYLGGGESSPIEMGISLEDFLSEWLTTQTTIDPITQQKIPMASIAEWDAEIIYISRMLIIAMDIMTADMSDLSNLKIGDKNYNAATTETFTTENAGFAQLLYLINYAKSFKIEGIRTLLSTFLVGEDSLISTEKELGIVVALVDETLIEAWNREIIAMMTVIEEAQDVIAALTDPDTDIMDQLSDPSKVENILLAFNQSQVLRVVLPDFIYTLLSTAGMEDWATAWLFDQTGVDEFGANNVTQSIAVWEIEISLLAKAISGINSALEGALGGGLDFTTINLGDVANHPMLPDYSAINPDFNTTNMGLAEVLFLVNHVKSLNIDALRDILGEFLIGEGSLVSTEKELGIIPGNNDLEKTQNWDLEIITIIDLLSQYSTLFGSEETPDFLALLDDSSKIANLLTPLNHSFILREILPDMINTLLAGSGTSELDGWFTDWLDDQVGIDGLGNNNPVASIAVWDAEIEILAKLIAVFNNAFSGALPTDISGLNVGDVNNHPILLGNDYDDTNPGLAELLYLMNYSKIFEVSSVRDLIGDFIVGPDKLINSSKALGTITGSDEEELLTAWDDEIKALVRIIDQYNTVFADVDQGDFLDQLTDKATIQSLLGNFNHSIILREVLPDLLYSVMPSEIVTDWVDVWLINQVGVDGLGNNKPVATIADWDNEIEQLAGMIEAYNISFSSGFSIDLDTMNLGDVDNNPRILGNDYDNTAPGLAEILYFMNQSKSFKVDEIRNIIGEFLVGSGNIIETDKELGTITAGTPEDLVIAWDAEIKALISVMESYNTTFAGSSDFLAELTDRSVIETLLGRFNQSTILREVLPDLLYSVMPSEIVTDWVDVWLINQVGVDGLGNNKPVANIADWNEEITKLAGMIEAYNISFSSGFSIDLDTMNLGDVDNNPRILGNDYDNAAPGLAEILYFMNQSKSFKIDEIRNILGDFLIGPGNLISTSKQLGTITAGTPEALVIAWDDEIYALISVMESYNSTFIGGDFLDNLTDRSVIETLLGRFNQSIMLREVLPDMLHSVLPTEILSDWVDVWLINQVGVDGLGDNKPVENYASWQTEISNIAGMIETYNKAFASGFSVDLATMPLGDVDNNPRILGNGYDNTSPGLAEMLYFMNQSKSFKIDEIRNILNDFLIGPGNLISTSKQLGTITAGTPEALVIAWDDEIYALISVMESYNSTFIGGDFLDNLTDRSVIETLLGRFNQSIMLREVLPDMVYSVLPSEIILDWVDVWLVNQVGVDGLGDNKPVENYASWQTEISNIAGMIETYNKAFSSGFNVDLATMPLGDVDNNPRILGNGYDNTSPGLAEMLYFMNQSKSFKIEELKNILEQFLVGPGKLINTPKELGTVSAGTPEALVIAWDEEIKDLITAIEKYNDITSGGIGTPLDLFSALDDQTIISDVLGAFNASTMLREILPDLINDIATSVGMTNWISTWLTNQVGVDGFGDNKVIASEAIWAIEVVKIATVIAEANNAFGGDMSALDISDSGLDADALGSVLHAMNDTDSFVLDELNNIMKDGLINLGYNVTNLNDKPATKAEWTTEIDAIVSIIKDMQIIGDVAVLDWNTMDSLMVDDNLDPVIRDIDNTTRQVTRGELLGIMLNTMGDSIILAPAMDQIIGSIFTSGGFDDYIDLSSIDLTELDWIDEIRAITSIKSDFDNFDGGADLRTLNSTHIENMILNSSQGVISSQIMGQILMDQFAFILGAKNPIDPITSEPYDWRDKEMLADNAHAIGNMIALGEALVDVFGGNLDDYEDVGNAMKELQPGIGVDRPAFADIYLPAFVDYASGEDGMLDSIDMTTVDYVLEGNAFNQFFEDWDRTDIFTSAATLPGAYATLQGSGAQVSLVIVDNILGY